MTVTEGVLAELSGFADFHIEHFSSPTHGGLFSSRTQGNTSQQLSAADHLSYFYDALDVVLQRGVSILIGQARVARFLGPIAKHSTSLYTYQTTHREAFASKYATGMRQRLIMRINEDLRDVTKYIGDFADELGSRFPIAPMGERPTTGPTETRPAALNETETGDRFGRRSSRKTGRPHHHHVTTRQAAKQNRHNDEIQHGRHQRGI